MHAWLLREREALSRSSEVLKPINYMLRRWDGFARFLEEGRICLTNNCAERALRGIALGRRNWTFAGSQRGADRAAIMLTMITTCRLNDVDLRPGSPTSSPASPIFPHRVCTNCCPGNGSSLEAACWTHGRRKFFDLAKSGEAPIAGEAVRRIDILFEIERTINGKRPEQRLAVRRDNSRPIVADLEIWMRQQRTLLSSGNDTAKAINYLLSRWAAFARFLDDGRVCLSNNAAERALRGAAVGRRNWTFAGSDAGGHRAAAVYTLIEIYKMNNVDPQVGSGMCWPGFQITPSTKSPTCSRGIGRRPNSPERLPPERHG